MKIRVSLIGLGNLLLRDEGVGVHAVEALREDFTFSEDFRLLDGGTLGLDLLPLIEGMEKVLFVDAVDFKKAPGTIAIIENEDLPSFLAPKLSLHHVGLSDLLFASSFMGTKPSQITLIGIQPEKIEIGLTLSDILNENFEKLLKTILKKLQEWGVNFRKKTKQEPSNVPGYPV
ncbi:MAG: HyaD/HybD family hydrogenase maturation endopeptidase [Proteobacteria bacterium]|nr:HyaD/HybD family hydrogenase maturation endopeptidase [Pseudomonadota bacterium]